MRHIFYRITLITLHNICVKAPIFSCINMDLPIRRPNVKGVNFWNRIELLGLLPSNTWIKNMKILIITSLQCHIESDFTQVLGINNHHDILFSILSVVIFCI